MTKTIEKLRKQVEHDVDNPVPFEETVCDVATALQLAALEAGRVADALERIAPALEEIKRRLPLPG
jgi:hypothetical protein